MTQDLSTEEIQMSAGRKRACLQPSLGVALGSFALAAVVATIGVSILPTTSVQAATPNVPDPVATANEVVRNAIYMKNNLVPNDCFMWSYYGSPGGPSMRTIDCAKIPPHLLITTNVPMPEPEHR
jgi:hypothetical protein